MPEKKYNKLLTAKQCQLIDWFNDNFKFGEVIIRVHASDPQDYTITKITGKFDGDVEKSVDRNT
jgi:hypothetical protein